MAQEAAKNELPVITGEQYKLLSEEEADKRFQEEEEANVKHKVYEFHRLLQVAKWKVCQWGLESGIEYAKKVGRPEAEIKDMYMLLEHIKIEKLSQVLLNKFVETNMNLDPRTSL